MIALQPGDCVSNEKLGGSGVVERISPAGVVHFESNGGVYSGRVVTAAKIKEMFEDGTVGAVHRPEVGYIWALPEVVERCDWELVKL